MVQDYEKLGVFYLGREQALADATPALLYDSADLTTHAVIIGMTGSGKTGLGVGLIEEAAIDGVPVIAVDPKGDLGNLLLSFPDLAPADFVPWVDPQQAAQSGQTVEAFAAGQADLWRNGLADWQQDGERIRRFRQVAEFGIFTPGSTAGTPISVLGGFAPPVSAVREDNEAFAERIEATTISILTLLGLDADPLTSREYILIANILKHCWSKELSLDMAGLIAAIQNPPIARIGVMDLEAIYPAKDRFALAMQLNNVLASPGFAAWMDGVPLSARDLLYTPEGRPRVSVMSIAHLNDRERMFFVTLLLTEIIAWMRAQPGTSSLRAILYMDELFGYMPPTANPPSKKLLLTLLKQARAFGLGLVLSTQNPMDLDYKGLSNTGTWFIGRLQTERDKTRVLDGLAGADSQGAAFDHQAMSATLSGLGKRVFLLHNVHEKAPVVFATRWTMSYLAGPLTRDQIRRLTTAPARHASPTPVLSVAADQPTDERARSTTRPTVTPGIDEYFAPAPAGASADWCYHPRLMAAADILYVSKSHGVDARHAVFIAAAFEDGPLTVDWNEAHPLSFTAGELTTRPAAGARFADLPSAANRASNYRSWESDCKRWLRQEQVLTVYRSAAYKLTSAVDESEADFRIRLQQVQRETRDLAAARLRASYEKKLASLQARFDKAEQAVESERSQATQRKIESAVSIGSALFGAFMGRKALSARTVSRMGTAARRTGRAARQAQDVGIAQERVGAAQAEMDMLSQAFEADVAALDTPTGVDAADIEPITVRARSSDIDLQLLALLWLPVVQA